MEDTHAPLVQQVQTDARMCASEIMFMFLDESRLDVKRFFYRAGSLIPPAELSPPHVPRECEYQSRGNFREFTMSLFSFVKWLSMSLWSVQMHESQYAYPIVESVHEHSPATQLGRRSPIAVSALVLQSDLLDLRPQ